MNKLACITTTPAQPVPPSVRVLDEEFTRRLGQLNAASRHLRQMGYRVTGQVLADTPTVFVERGDDGSIARLLDCSGRPYWRSRAGVKYGCAEFMNVVVTWREQ